MDLGSISTIGVTVGQTLTFNLAAKVWGPSQEELGQGLSDILCINNLSGVTFQVTLQPSTRQFTLPPGVPTNPLQLAWKGITTTFLTLYVESIASGTFANQVHFDWFAPGEPVLYVAASSVGATGSISVPNVTTNSVTWPTPDNWIMQEDGSGNMDITDTTTSKTFALGRNGSISTDAALFKTDGSGNATANMYLANGAAGTRYFEAQIPSTTSDQNAVIDIADNTVGGVEWFLGKQSHVNGDFFRIFDNTNSKECFRISPNAAGVIIDGAIQAVGGVVTVGSFGAPIIVAQTAAAGFLVSTVGSKQVLTYTPAGNGLYEIHAYIEFRGSVASALTMDYVYTDDIGGNTKHPSYSGQSTTNPVLVNGNTSFTPSISMVLAPLTFFAKTTGAITINYNDPSGTPNDLIFAQIWRLQ